MASLQNIIAFTISFLTGVSLSDGPSGWVIWNVGQGQWVTELRSHRCRHFDAGGELNPIQKVNRLCAKIQNEFYFSHWDWDHIGFAYSARALDRACVAVKPQGATSPRKNRVIQQMSSCKQIDTTAEVQVFTPKLPSRSRPGSNHLSHVFTTAEILAPGDLPKTLEDSVLHGHDLSHIRLLIVGHHGSRSSTSQAFLERLPNLKMAIASQRSARYGHPHREVIEKIKGRKAALIRTEDWGSILVRSSRVGIPFPDRAPQVRTRRDRHRR